MYVHSNPRTIAMYKYWYKARLRNPGKHDQDVLNVILREKDFDGIESKFGSSTPFSSRAFVRYGQ